MLLFVHDPLGDGCQKGSSTASRIKHTTLRPVNISYRYLVEQTGSQDRWSVENTVLPTMLGWEHTGIGEANLIGGGLCIKFCGSATNCFRECGGSLWQRLGREWMER